MNTKQSNRISPTLNQFSQMVNDELEELVELGEPITGWKVTWGLRDKYTDYEIPHNFVKPAVGEWMAENHKDWLKDWIVTDGRQVRAWIPPSK